LNLQGTIEYPTRNTEYPITKEGANVESSILILQLVIGYSLLSVGY